ncbi:signal peptidase I [bacterium]|nr:signal peptidase I [candidate division CSSED10-310 bacterium]
MSDADSKRSKRSDRILREIKEWSKSILWGAVFIYFFTGYVFKAYRVEGTSMQPLLQNAERLFVNRIVYKFRDIERGDVVVFYFPAQPHDYFIKRVIGLPGEKIYIKKGKIFINDRLIDDHYVPNYFKSYEDVGTQEIPLGYYFVSGDHRNKSYDSRAWVKDRRLSAFVPLKYIVGKASFRYWPLNQIGPIRSNFEPNGND